MAHLEQTGQSLDQYKGKSVEFDEKWIKLESNMNKISKDFKNLRKDCLESSNAQLTHAEKQKDTTK